MKKKSLFGLIAISTITLSTCVGLVALVGSNSISIPTRADQTYSLTIDASNKSNFVQDGDVYRGTFKTGLGNDIVFRMKSAPSSKEGVTLEMTSTNDYLINETPLRGVTSMEVTGHYLNYKGELGTGYALYVYYLADLDMANLDKDTLTNSTNTISSIKESDHTYVVDTGSGISRAGSAYYYIGNKDSFYSNSTWVIDSVKYYFSCQSTRTYVSVTSSDSSLGLVSINGETFVSSRYTVVANGTSVTIHANPISDFENELFYTFKGWRLNGSEEYISTNPDYTFTTAQDGSYKFVADFDEESKEVFTEGVRLCSSGNYGILSDEEKDTFVKSYDGAYYGFESGCEGDNTQNLDERGNGNLWRQYANGQKMPTPYLILNKNHDNYYYKENEHSVANKVTVKDFDPSVVSCIELVFDKNSSYARDDLSISGGATSFGHTKKSITDTDSKTISKFFITNFDTSNIKISIPDKIESQYFFQLKRVVVHYKVVIPELQND